MKKAHILSAVKSVFTFVILVAIATACSNSTSNDEEHEHPEPEGALLTLNGEVVVAKYPDNDNLINNFPSVTAGDQTGLITVQFIDHDGDPVEIEEPEAYLRFNISNSSVIDVEQPEDWAFLVTALSEGSAELTMELMHEDHPDFTLPAFTIEVMAAE
ncbi:hypothetical protein [Gracilimonas mengyeensis]|uniref:DUF4625 domain-containing protein n=1 Tax=Gracilimonas mengyeensis TaxID=1302730 RepID=A0A521EED1_9BACT|nr:hypothetical protein [Gracilimonas mengyeensis]SMO82258.1 hypothetical protein SAMN06265219_111143 [Gracilimonas mengyeensis]